MGKMHVSEKSLNEPVCNGAEWRLCRNHGAKHFLKNQAAKLLLGYKRVKRDHTSEAWFGTENPPNQGNQTRSSRTAPYFSTCGKVLANQNQENHKNHGPPNRPLLLYLQMTYKALLARERTHGLSQ